MDRSISGVISSAACVVLVALVFMLGSSTTACAETETATVHPGMFFALFFELSEGVELEFNMTSTVAVYVGVLDSTNYDSYSSTGDYTSTLFVTSSAVYQAEATVEAPADGRYYLIVENSVSSSSASVTIEYEFKGTGFSISGLALAMIVGGVAGAIIYRRRKSRKAVPGQQSGSLQDEPPFPPLQPPP
jgi:hypothetical protein